MSSVHMRACVNVFFLLVGRLGGRALRACVNSYEIDLAAGLHRTFDLDFF